MSVANHWTKPEFAAKQTIKNDYRLLFWLILFIIVISWKRIGLIYKHGMVKTVAKVKSTIKNSIDIIIMEYLIDINSRYLRIIKHSRLVCHIQIILYICFSLMSSFYTNWRYSFSAKFSFYCWFSRVCSMEKISNNSVVLIDIFFLLSVSILHQISKILQWLVQFGSVLSTC